MSNLMKIDEILTTADHFIKSKLFADIKDVSVAIVKIQAGLEIGLKPFQSMSSFDIIQGKMVLKPYAMASVAKNTGKYSYIKKQHDEAVCVLEWFENGKSIGLSDFTIEDAQKAGLTGKQVWKQYTKDMLFNRALSRGCRQFAMDAFMMPIYVEGELDEPIKETTYNEVKTVVNEPKKQVLRNTVIPMDKLISILQNKAKDYKGQNINNLDTLEFLESLNGNLTAFLKAVFNVKYVIDLSTPQIYALQEWIQNSPKEIVYKEFLQFDTKEAA